MKILRIILYPVVPFYYLAIKIRNLFFDINFFKSKSVNAKVISVGNLTVGGMGKTPLVVYLTNKLLKTGMKPGVLSRGYGRRSKGYLLVSDGENIFTSVDQCGDEIYQTYLECKVPASVSEDRVQGARKFILSTGVKSIVLDDAFQHRWINRDLNLLIFDQKFLLEKDFFKQNLLPTGNMREPFSSVNRADAIIINRKFSEKKDIPVYLKKYFADKNIFTAYYETKNIVDLKTQTIYNIAEFEGQKSLVVSGIANPFSFINILKRNTVDTKNQIIFRDHKHYTLKEVQRIRKEFYSTNSHSVITTEKDAVKLTEFSKELDDIDVFYLKIEIKIDDEDSFMELLKNKINK